MNGRVPDSFLWLRFPCQDCGDTVCRVRGHDPIPPNDPRNPQSRCEPCRAEHDRTRSGHAASVENNLGPDMQRDAIAAALLAQAFGGLA